MAKKKKRGHKRPQKKQPIVSNIGRQDPIAHDETFCFSCQRCGECCHRVRDAVPVESIDLFKLGRHFKAQGHPNGGDLGLVMMEMTNLRSLSVNGFPAFFLKSQAPRDRCIFLDGITCSVQPAKPRACKVYPLSAHPNDAGNGLQALIVSRKMHHFTGPEISAGDWLKDCLDVEDAEFILCEPHVAVAIEDRLRVIKQNSGLYEQTMKQIIFLKYLNYDLDKPFMPQYRSNTRELLARLDVLVRKI